MVRFYMINCLDVYVMHVIYIYICCRRMIFGTPVHDGGGQISLQNEDIEDP